MREIKLTRGLVALVDDADYEQLSAFKWQAQSAGVARDNWYAVRSVQRGTKRVTLGMHRAIMEPGPGLEVDHKDRNGLNNQRENLRPCSHHLNGGNRLCATSSSGYRGVYWHKTHKKWRARARVKNKYIHIGHFDDPREAAIARDKFVAPIFGEFAILNFPDGVDA